MSSELRRRFTEYKSKIKSAKTHPAKEIIFFNFLRDIFGIDVEELALKTEKPLKSKVYKVRGRADLIYRGVILEVKVDLKKELEQGLKELKKYTLLLAEEGETDYIGIITDGIDFRAYIMPKSEIQKAQELLKQGQEFDDVLDQVSLKEVSSFRVNDNAEEFILWLDSYFFTQRNIKPTAEDLQIKFGLESPTFTMFFEKFKELFNKVKDISSVKLKFSLWRRHLEIVYGSAPDEDEFIIHTYLVTLVKLIMYLRLYGARSSADITKIIDGTYFRELGILNFIEEDFFTWILEEPIKDETLKLVKRLLNELDVYDFDQADEDLFKEIYQDIVGPSTRHAIGEYYTPEWLAELTLLYALKFLGKKDELPSILDPACGSGTFLTNAIIYYKRTNQIPDDELLELILRKIKGIDINPLAVIIARANYIIALGDLIKRRRGEIIIPVYLADAIVFPKAEKSTLAAQKIKVYRYQVKTTKKNLKGEIYLYVPESIVQNEILLGKILGKMRELLGAYRSRKIDEKSLTTAFNRYAREINLSDEEINVLTDTISNLKFLIDNEEDTIWLYILRNIYAPIRMKEEKFDIVIGNPPWIAFRYIQNKTYQEKVKELIFIYDLLDKDKIHLYTQMEFASLFFRRCADLYLREGGIIAFVMPRSVLTGARQHEKFKEFSRPSMKLLIILDMNYNTKFKVEPLFNVPSCVLIAKKGEETKYPVPAIAYSATLTRKNEKLVAVEPKLKIKKYKYEWRKIKFEKSPYYDLFKAGAAIYPRPLWFIDFVVDEKLGINPNKPKVKSSYEAIKDAKGQWKNVYIEGSVESKFIFATLLSKDIKPFGYEKLRPIVLPVVTKGRKFILLSIDQLKSLGYLGMADWLRKAQECWIKYATKKDKRNFPKVEMQINHLNLLEKQDPFKRYLVVSAASGTYTASCVIDRKEALKPFKINEIQIAPLQIVLDKKTFYFETDDELEAHYLCAIINSNVVDNLIKSMNLQTKGLWGERDIGRAIFELPIPKFNPDDPKHRRLAELSKICHEAIKKIKVRSRKKIKEKLARYVKEIDALVEEILLEHSS